MSNQFLSKLVCGSLIGVIMTIVVIFGTISRIKLVKQIYHTYETGRIALWSNAPNNKLLRFLRLILVICIAIFSLLLISGILPMSGLTLGIYLFLILIGIVIGMKSLKDIEKFTK